LINVIILLLLLLLLLLIITSRPRLVCTLLDAPQSSLDCYSCCRLL